MTMFTLSFLGALGLFVVLRVPGTSVLCVNPIPQVSDKDEIVNKHNELRRGVEPSASNMLEMRWDHEAADNAREWAQQCIIGHSKGESRRIHSSGCGENIYASTFKNSWSNTIQSWYNEVNNWEYEKGSINGKVVGHYTQVVWAKSNKIGCAMAYCGNSKYKYIYVCHYCPPGNYQYTHPYKKGAPCADCPQNCHNKLCTCEDRRWDCPYLKMYCKRSSRVAEACRDTCNKCTT